jgi:hypothetical protein
MAKKNNLARMLGAGLAAVMPLAGAMLIGCPNPASGGDSNNGTPNAPKNLQKPTQPTQPVAVPRNFTITLYGNTINIVDETNDAKSLQARGLITKLQDAATAIEGAVPPGSGYSYDNMFAAVNGGTVTIKVQPGGLL